MRIPTYNQWLQDTTLNILRPRSSQLKAVDEAIRQYEITPNPEALFRIKNAFEDWKRLKGAAWENSDRNQRHALQAISTLFRGKRVLSDMKDLFSIPS
jgi:hypothetical protein